MTSLLKEAFEKASRLPPDLQDQIAQHLLDEIEWEFKWDKTLASSDDLLEKLANKAIKDFEAGKTHQKGFDEL
jgi:hypothetical protein